MLKVSIFLVSIFCNALCQKPIIHVVSIGDCADANADGWFFNGEYNSDTRDGTATIGIAEDIDDAFKCKLSPYSQNDDGSWKEAASPMEGACCDIINKYVYKAWGELRKHVDPPIESDCSVAKGTYFFDVIGLTTDSVNVSAQPGPYKIEAAILKDDKSVFCQAMTLKIEAEK